MALRLFAARHYARQSLLARSTTLAALALWGRVSPRDPVGSWVSQRLAERVFVLVAMAQERAATNGAEWVPLALGEQGADSVTPTVVPRALAGVASDGRDLESLLVIPARTVSTARDAGLPNDQAMARGTAELAMIVDTQVADAGRAGETVAMTAEPAVTGWVRMLSPPSCARCIILAGRTYRWSDGFTRHPRCDCLHIPVVEDVPDDVRTDPAAYFRSLSERDQDRYFTRAGAESIRMGADINQVVNVRRKAGLSTASGRRQQRRGRLMPEAIMDAAEGDRDVAVDLLRRYGYIV